MSYSIEITWLWYRFSLITFSIYKVGIPPLILMSRQINIEYEVIFVLIETIQILIPKNCSLFVFFSSKDVLSCKVPIKKFADLRCLKGKAIFTCKWLSCSCVRKCIHRKNNHEKTSASFILDLWLYLILIWKRRNLQFLPFF